MSLLCECYFYCILLIPLFALIISLLLTKYLINILPKLGFIDQPKAGHIHKTPVPTCGGIAIVLSFLFTSLIFVFLHSDLLSSTIKSKLPGIYITFITLFIVGIIDDKFELRYKVKLLFQILVATMCYFFDIRMTSFVGLSLGPVASYILTVLWFFFFINGFNLVDGLDGLAGGIGAISAFFIGFIFFLHGNFPEGIISITLMGSILGFLRYNYHPAKIFMGDTGSMSIGYLIAVSGLLFSNKSAALTAILVPMAAAGIPWFDGFLALWRRLSKKLHYRASKAEISQKMLDRDTEHLHHRIFKLTRSQTLTVKIIYLISILSGALATCLTFSDSKIRSLAFLILVLLTVTCFKKLAYWEFWHSSQIFISGVRRPRKRTFVIFLEPVFDLIFICISFTFCFYVFNQAHEYFKEVYFLKRLTIYSFPIVLIMHLSRIYRTFWIRASAHDYLYLIEVIFLGNISSFIVSLFVFNNIHFMMQLGFFMVFFSFTAMLIIGERLFLRYMKHNFIKKAYQLSHSDEKSKRVLLCGVSVNCKFYLYNLYRDRTKTPETIVGIIDDTKYLYKQYVYATKILGTANDLYSIYSKLKFDKIVITSDKLSKNSFKLIKEFCHNKSIEITSAVFKESAI